MGGIGTAPLLPLIQSVDSDMIIGAKTKDELLFHNKAKNIRITTDDGSLGFKGFTTELLKKKLKKKRYSVIYTCGPELMIKAVFDICEKNKIECQASLERYMKCAIGICDQCSINHFRVCKEGPVFGSENLRKMTELGKFARSKSGKIVTINQYIK